MKDIKTYKHRKIQALITLIVFGIVLFIHMMRSTKSSDSPVIFPALVDAMTVAPVVVVTVARVIARVIAPIVVQVIAVVAATVPVIQPVTILVVIPVMVLAILPVILNASGN